MSKEKLDPNERIKRAVDSEIEQVYFNGFAVGAGTGDVVIILEKNGKPIQVLNASYTIAKTLSQKLAGIIKGVESATENETMSKDYIEKKIAAKKEPK